MYQRMFPSLSVDVEAELKRYEEYAEKVRPLVTETVHFLNKSMREGRTILVEGANAAMLDIDFGKLNVYYSEIEILLVDFVFLSVLSKNLLLFTT